MTWIVLLGNIIFIRKVDVLFNLIILIQRRDLAREAILLFVRVGLGILKLFKIIIVLVY